MTDAPKNAQLEYAAPAKRGNEESRVGVWAFRVAIAGLLLFVAELIAFHQLVPKPTFLATTSATTGPSPIVLAQNYILWRLAFGLVNLICLSLAIAALVLGIIGVSQRSYSRRWALIGLIFACVLLGALVVTG